MKRIDNLSYEVYYIHLDGKSMRRMAAFHFRFEAEKYIEIFHSSEKEQFFIKEVEE